MNATDCTFVVYQNGRILMQQRDDKPKIRYPGAWCFPGEGLEESESSLDAVLRGLFEEYELVVSAQMCRLVTQYQHDGTDVDDIFFVQLGSDQKPVLREGKAFGWKTLTEIKLLLLGFEQEQILNELEKFLINAGLSA